MQNRLWAGWRSEYVNAQPPAGEGSLFERILTSGLPDEETYVVWRGRWASALLNLYPYTTGHVLVLPNRAAPDLDELTEDEATELWQGIRRATTALKAAYGCHGLNVGFNLGRAGARAFPTTSMPTCCPGGAAIPTSWPRSPKPGCCPSPST